LSERVSFCPPRDVAQDFNPRWVGWEDAQADALESFNIVQTAGGGGGLTGLQQDEQRDSKNVS
jgi:hypothetical protein